MFEILQPGLLSTLQDGGRRGLRHLGIPWAGAMVPSWQTIANTLVGNKTDNTIIECFEGGFSGQFQHPARIAIAADDSAVLTLVHENTETRCLPFRSYNVKADTKLVIKNTGNVRLAVLALHGLEISPQLGSTATYTKAALGGIQGRALTAGDELLVSESFKGPSLSAIAPPVPGLANGILHAVPGPQNHHFSDQALDAFFASKFKLTAEVDRMGARLQGPVIEHLNTAARDIVSDAILPGSVQVPGNGQPIILLADAHTAGGYPKIATIASSDLSALALARPGNVFQFKETNAMEAVYLTRDVASQLQQALSSLQVVSNTIDTENLLSHNLIDGVTDGSN